MGVGRMDGMASQLVQRVKGTRDFYPEDWEYIRWLSGRWLELGRSYGYQEYEGPLLEPIELYLGKSSQEIVNDQTFPVKDRDGKTLVLRPELTPTLARMVAAREGELVLPVRWQSWGSFYRYEKPQRGRGRAFYQWNIDLLGTDSPHADAEILTIACRALQVLGLPPADVTIRVNDRLSFEGLLRRRLELEPEAVHRLFGPIDRLDKMGVEVFRLECARLGLEQSRIDTLLGLLENRDLGFSPTLQHVFDEAAQAGLAGYLELDLQIVRGFDYYTGMVFEAWGKGSLRRALFGGGRYDNLTVQVGGKKRIPGVGFAMGDMAIGELLKDTGRYPALTATPTRLLVAVFGQAGSAAAGELARELRSAGVSCELYVDVYHRLDRQLKYADRKGIPIVALLGEEEIATGTVMLKDLGTHSQRRIGRADVVRTLQDS
jgi:histidyl-tRNA synthetase